MPASIVDSVSSALRLSLTADDKNSSNLLDSRLISSAKSVLLSKIEFEESGNYQSNLLEGLKSKYVVLKPEKRLNDDKTFKKDTSNSYNCGRPKQEICLPSPKKILFPLSSVQLGWEPGWQVGAGMQNVGNTCYLNSTLQAVFHVPAFANWLMSEDHHAEKCYQSGGCVICGMKRTLMDSQNSGSAIKPWQVYSKLRMICRHLTPGRQEDAHEFLRYLVESMEKAYLSLLGPSGERLDQFSKETTPLNQILGGYLRSAVRCLACAHVSTTFQHFQDLLVDARKANTLDEALNAFFSRERLEDLGYKCESCDKKVSATKQFFIERAPMVLCIALKRFSVTGGKLSKHVQFRPRISLKKFMFHQNSQATLDYRLVSVVTHLGHSQNNGHYTAIGLGPSGNFYQFDDSSVRAIPTSNVVGTNAYIMFYELEKSDSNGNKQSHHSSPVKSSIFSKKDNGNSNFIGPILPENLKNKENSPMKSKLTPLKVNCMSERNNLEHPHKISTIYSEKAHPSINDNAAGGSLLSTSPCRKKEISQKDGFDSKTNGKGTYSNENGRHWNSMPDLSPGVVKNGPMGKSTMSDSGYSLTNGNGNCSKESKSTNGCSSFKSKIKLSNGDADGENKCDAGSGSSSFASSPLSSSGSQHAQHDNGNGKTNGSSKSIRGLVPYDSESGGENHDDEDDNDEIPSNKSSQERPVNKPLSVTKSTEQGWRVSSDVPPSQHSPSLNGVANNKGYRSSDFEQTSRPTNGSQKDVVSQLQRFSHRGYGGPVDTWNGTHAQLNRQVFEDKKNQLKRAAEAEDEMDSGRVKKVRHNDYSSHNGSSQKYYNGGTNSRYNAFQESQNQSIRWNEANNSKGGSSRGFFHYNRNFRHGMRGRFNSHHQSRHHSNGHHHHRQHHHYNRNR